MTSRAAALVALGSARATPVLLIVLAGLLCLGLVLPQGVTADAVARAYSASTSQVVVGLGLHHVVTSWPFQLVCLLLLLNLAGRAALRGPSRPVSDMPALQGWRATADGSGTITARRGFWVEGLSVLGLGAALLLGVAHYGHVAERGTVEVVTGGDDVARSRSRAFRRIGDRDVPWTPPFRFTCEHEPGQALLAARRCLIEIEGKPHQATVEPRRDLEFRGRRFTLVGVRPVPGIGGFELRVEDPTGVRDVVASVGAATDVEGANGRIATLLPTGTATGAPVGVLLPEGRSGAGVSVSARPRVMLELEVTPAGTEPWIWAGMTLALIGLLVAGTPASYVATLRRGPDGAWRIDVQGRGLLARTQTVADGLRASVHSEVKA